MDKDLKNGIKKLLLLDSLLQSTSTVSEILDEVEEELEEIFGNKGKKSVNVEEIFKALK